MPNASSPRKRGHAGRAAATRVVEVEYVLPGTARSVATGRISATEGLRLLLEAQKLRRQDAEDAKGGIEF
jgi:hypothetical protein